MGSCIFCEISKEQAYFESASFWVIRDRFPVTEGHLLIIPKLHRADLFELSREEFFEFYSILHELKQKVMNEDVSISGFNIGANAGASAGQTVFHCHFHFIPRRVGDVEDPRGGVRGVIPSKQKY